MKFSHLFVPNFARRLLVILLLCALDVGAQSPHPGMGAIPVGGGVSFRVWAPNAEAVHVRGEFNAWSLEDSVVSEGANGMWSAFIPDASVGDAYKFFVTNNDPTSPNGTTAWRRDPYSRELDYFVPGDANSVVYDPTAYAWQTGPDFAAPALDDLVIYEMHIGSFNAPTGVPATFPEAIARLDHLVSLGVNAVEVMPLHENPGDNGWGYGPTQLFAIEESFGGADGFKSFVDACHARGLAVLVDVVYNHAGSTQNDLWEFDLASEGVGGGIWFFNDADNANTPWGPRFNFSRDPVRQFFLQNVRMYLEEFRVDGFRFDATAFLRYGGAGDVPGAASLLREINTMIDTEFPGSIVIAEDFDPDRLASRPIANGGLGFDAEWDRFYESPARVLSAATDAARDLADLEAALERTLNGAPFRRVIYAESHDTAAPEEVPYLVLPFRGAYLPRRIDGGNPETDLTTRRLALIGSVLALTAPGIPMLFMGQELYETGVFEYPSPGGLNWSTLLAQHAGIVDLHCDLIALRRDTNGVSAGLRSGIVDVHHRNDAAKVIAFLRSTAAPDPAGGGEVLVVLNLSATDFTLGYSVGVPRSGRWYVHLNTESVEYDPAFSVGPGQHAELAAIEAEASGLDGEPARLTIPRLRPYSVMILSQASNATYSGISTF